MTFPHFKNRKNGGEAVSQFSEWHFEDERRASAVGDAANFPRFKDRKIERWAATTATAATNADCSPSVPEDVATVAVVAGAPSQISTAAEGGPADGIPGWRHGVCGFTPHTAIGEKVHAASLAFLNSDLATVAADLGWNELELFGVFDHEDPAVINRRPDAKGIIVFVALAVWPGTRIESFHASHSVIVTGSGGVFISPKRFAASSIAFWDSGVL
jgi:hypothetical protein